MDTVLLALLLLMLSAMGTLTLLIMGRMLNKLDALERAMSDLTGRLGVLEERHRLQESGMYGHARRGDLQG